MSPIDWPSDRPLVCDTNVVLSALIGGIARQVIFELDRPLHYPEPSFDEINRNRAELQARSGLSGTAIDAVLDRLFTRIALVPQPVILTVLGRAERARSPHPDADPDRPFVSRDQGDVVFLATAIAIEGDLWSDDQVFQHQPLVEWYRTEDLLEHVSVDS